MDEVSKLKAAVLGGSEPPAVEPWARELVLRFETEGAQATHGWAFARCDPQGLATGREILARSKADWTALVPAILGRLVEISDERVRGVAVWRRAEPLNELLVPLLRPRLPFVPDKLAAVIDFYAVHLLKLPRIPERMLLRQVKYVADGADGAQALAAGLLGAAVGRLQAAAQTPLMWATHARHVLAATKRLIARDTEDGPALAASPWRDHVLGALVRLPDARREAARRALDHALRAGSKSQPSQAFLDAARALTAQEPALAAQLIEWIEAYVPDPADRDPNEDAIRGLVWIAATGDEATVAPRLGRYGELCFKKIPNVGAHSVKLGNGALQALCVLGGPHAIAELTRLKKRLRYPLVVRRIDEMLAELASRLGMSAGEIEEMVLPTYDLSVDGERRLPVGDGMAILRIVGSREVALRWVRPDGGETASVPKALKETAADAVAAARKLKKEIEQTLAGQSARIETLYLSARKLPLAQWRARYLDHPLLAGLTRRLVWRFDAAGMRVDGLARDGALEDVGGRPIALPQDATVTLWHPLAAKADEVLAWRRRLGELGVTQPFRQAHREIYVVTDAERQTDIYSNRFAAHILRQHQFKALCDQRGWQYHLMGAWDSHNTPQRTLPDRGVSVQFWVHGVEGEIAQSFVYTLISTDQVRFVAADGTAIRVADLPPLLFSELMRDVDLFVGVASVGNDPDWVDGGPQGQFGAYWHRYAFGDLGQTGTMRGEALAALLPSLAIADRCRLEGRFLTVDGRLRSYKIHLGSGNIQMAPNDQYLCIVPSQSANDKGLDKLVLPFEGDRTLSIILSKAFLLAADDKITDPTILRQIKHA